MSRVLIFSGQPAVLDYIRIQDGGKLAEQTFFHAGVHFFEVGAVGKYYRGNARGERAAAIGGNTRR